MHTNNGWGDHDDVANAPTTLSLDSFVRDPKIQARVKGTDPRLVERYRTVIRNARALGQEPDFPPVLIARFEKTLFLVDGFHRTKAFECEGCSRIPATIVEASGHREVAWMGAQANLKNAKQLTQTDKREAFRRFVRSKAYTKASRTASKARRSGRPQSDWMSLREIAEATCVGRSTVRRWMQTDFPSTYAKYYAREDGSPPLVGENLGDGYRPYIGDRLIDYTLGGLRNAAASMASLSGDHLDAVISATVATMQALSTRLEDEPPIGPLQHVREAIAAAVQTISTKQDF
jgi:hypothetical protein